MTRKQALEAAMGAINDPIAQEKIKEILEDMPFTQWSERTIFDTVDQFILDNGRSPTVREFDKRGMPPHPVIKNRFGITTREFLDKYYPTQRRCDSNLYYTKSKEEWLSFFMHSYNSLKPTSAEHYNKERPKGSPTWYVYAKLYGLSKWNELLEFAKLDRYKKGVKIIPKGKSIFNVISHNDLLIALAEFEPKHGKSDYSIL